MFDAYLVNLALLVALIAGGIYSRTQKQQPQAGPPPESSVEANDKESYDGGDTTSDLRFRAFRNRFLRVYVLAVGADWLQVRPPAPVPDDHASSRLTVFDC